MYRKEKLTVRSVVLMMVFVFFTVSLLFASESPSPSATSQPTQQDKGISVVPEEGNATISLTNDGKIKAISFKKDADIKDVLRFLGARYSKNIVPSPKVTGPITVTNLYDVTFEQAMDAIMGDNYQWQQRGNIIEVFPKEDKSRMTYKVFTLSYITADEAKKIITPILSSAGQVGFTTPAQKGVPTGESITSITGGDTIAASDTIVIFDYPERIEQAERIMREVDVKPKQVLVEATILSVLLTENNEFGIDWNIFNGIDLQPFEINADAATGIPGATGSIPISPSRQVALGGEGTPVQTTGFANPRSDGLRAVISSDNVKVFITALETIADTTVLANPKILAVNKQLGEVYIGNKIGYVDQTTQTQTSTTQAVKFLDTGTKLSFRPYISDDGYVRMDIHPKDSTGALQNNNIPNESATELATNIVVKDGQTIVIGGLFRDAVTTTRNQVPILGDIPLIGFLFRSTVDKVERQEIIVLLTPHIINEAKETDPQGRIDDVRLKREALIDELQSIDRAKIAEDNYSAAVKSYLAGDKEKALEEVKRALHFRPTYLEALRLRERIMKEINPSASSEIDSIMRDKVEQKDTQMWQRK